MEANDNKLILLKSMGDKGAKRAVESLAMMLDMEVDMKISTVNMVSLFTIPDIVGNKEMVSLISPFSGTFSGNMICQLSPEGTVKLASALLGDLAEEESDEMFDEMQKSAASEIGNIITSSFLDIWADTFSIEISHEPPIFIYDFADAVIDCALIDAAKTGDFVILFNSTLNVTNMDIDFTILILPDPEKLQMVFDQFKNIEIEPQAA